MDDILLSLRLSGDNSAADEIERLRAINHNLLMACEDLLKFFKTLLHQTPDDEPEERVLLGFFVSRIKILELVIAQAKGEASSAGPEP